MTGGLLVIESDDGGIGSHSHWWPLLRERRQDIDYFPFSRDVPACMGICLGLTGVMDNAQRLELQAHGWEMQNHGRTHSAISAHTLTQSASVGATRVYVNDVNKINFNRSFATATYTISSGTTSQTVTVTGRESTTATVPGWVDFTEPLTAAYGVGATFRLSGASLEDEVNVHLDDLLALGLNVENYTTSFMAWDADAAAFAQVRHRSTRAGVGNNPIPPNISQLVVKTVSNLQGEGVGTWLDAIKANNYMGIFLGHSETWGEGSMLTDLADGAIARGIPVVTRSEALDIIDGTATVPPAAPTVANGKVSMRVKHLLLGESVVMQSFNGTGWDNLTTTLTAGTNADGTWDATADGGSLYRASLLRDGTTVYSGEVADPDEPSHAFDILLPTPTHAFDIRLLADPSRDVTARPTASASTASAAADRIGGVRVASPLPVTSRASSSDSASVVRRGGVRVASPLPVALTGAVRAGYRLLTATLSRPRGLWGDVITVWRKGPEVDYHATWAREIITDVRLEERDGAVAALNGMQSMDGAVLYIKGRAGLEQLHAEDRFALGESAAPTPPNNALTVTSTESHRLRGRLHHWEVAAK